MNVAWKGVARFLGIKRVLCNEGGVDLGTNAISFFFFFFARHNYDINDTTRCRQEKC